MKKILVIDDDVNILEVVKVVLEAENYQVMTSTTGRYIQDLLSDLPDLIILDILLANEDGREIALYLKSQDLTKSIPIIMFSAHYRDDIQTLLRQSHADSFLPKPFDITDLTELVKLYTTHKIISTPAA